MDIVITMSIFIIGGFDIMKIKAMDVILDGIKKKTDNDNAIKYFTDIMDNYISITSLPEYKPFNGLYDIMVKN